MRGITPAGAGSRLGSYTIVRELGEGGMGIVYEAEHRLLGRKVAIKTIRRDIASSPTLSKRILLEARAIAALDHPGIVRLYDFGFEGTLPYIVMEWVPGHTLAQLIRANGPLGPAAAIQLLRPIANALEHAHWNGVIHRDVKPGNVLLAEDGRVMIMDFGLAYVINQRAGTEPDSILGTADYMAPEQVAKEPIDCRTDTYSLAAVIFHVVTGRPPFLGKGWLEVAWKRLTEPPPLACDIVPAVSRRFSVGLAMALARDASRRPSGPLELIELLAKTLTPDESPFETNGALARAPVHHSARRMGLARRALLALRYP